MVTLSSTCWLALVLIAQAPGVPEPAKVDSFREVRSALGKEKLPWYDEKTDAINPIDFDHKLDSTPDPASSSPEVDGGILRTLGNALTMIGFACALGVLIGLLIWLWKILEPTGYEEPPQNRKKSGEPSRVDSLPEGMEREFETSDPWEEAIRRRNRGDLAGAVICLFAHQLLTLSKLGLVRLAPGRTGRQLVRAVTDPELRNLVHPTLRLFEVVYYGHRSPSESEFATVWTSAELFERQVAMGVVR